MHEAFSAYDQIATLDAIAAQRTAEARGAEPNVENLLPPTVDAAEGLDIDVAEAGSYRDGLEIYRRARSGKKQLVVAEGFSHYDQPEPVKIALDALIPFFNKNL
ncbi:hypothetical protein MLGJGCBP_07996 [Rhodococcus sp. T7]|nr:hypothetical protein MLGJGCBP_07996 [Rhodococcus sp. T7]